MTCPRCRRQVSDTDPGRKAHRQSCVAIPEHRPRRWGKKKKKKEVAK